MGQADRSCPWRAVGPLPDRHRAYLGTGQCRLVADVLEVPCGDAVMRFDPQLIVLELPFHSHDAQAYVASDWSEGRWAEPDAPVWGGGHWVDRFVVQGNGGFQQMRRHGAL